jgi:hypothetical protein
MGIGLADLEGHGVPSLFVTNYEGEKHALYVNDWKPGQKIEELFFTHSTTRSGIAAIGQIFVGWGTAFIDLENRGVEDLLIINGHVIRHPTAQGASRKQRPILMRNKGGVEFREISKGGGAYFQTVHCGRGFALGDLDNDGRVDAVISHVNDPVAVLKNVAPERHWLGLDLRGKENRNIVGATIKLEAGGKTQWRFAKSGGSYGSSFDPRFVFGLGDARQITKLTVYWPDRTEQTWENLAADKYHRLTQGAK